MGFWWGVQFCCYFLCLLSKPKKKRCFFVSWFDAFMIHISESWYVLCLKVWIFDLGFWCGIQFGCDFLSFRWNRKMGFFCSWFDFFFCGFAVSSVPGCWEGFAYRVRTTSQDLPHEALGYQWGSRQVQVLVIVFLVIIVNYLLDIFVCIVFVRSFGLRIVLLDLVFFSGGCW